MTFMNFDPTNKIVKLCIHALDLEAQFRNDEARSVFENAWDLAESALEKIIAAHYLARHQEALPDKLRWNRLALDLGLRSGCEQAGKCLPSLYLNVGKDYEDMGDLKQAKLNYREGIKLQDVLGEDGYGRMIFKGLHSGMERVIFKEVTF